MNKLKNILFLFILVCCFSTPTYASSHPHGEEEGFDATEMIFGHIGDAYSFHVTSIGEHHISVPLPIILRSEERGWFFFMSSKLGHGGEHEGFSIQHGGDYDGKLIETNSQGEVVRPFDLSFTKNVFSIFLSCGILLLVFIPMSRTYKKDPIKTPGKLHNAMEAMVLFIQDDIIEPAIGKKGEKFTPYLLTVFVFILLNNFLGLIPIFPFGANITGNISVTFVLAMFTFVITNAMGTKAYYKEVIWPDVPVWLKVPIPMMPIIEIISTITKPFALMVRLFANIFAGHMVALVLMALIFIFADIMGPKAATGISVLSISFTVFMYFIEILAAVIQAYVFTMLSALFIGLAQEEHH